MTQCVFQKTVCSLILPRIGKDMTVSEDATAFGK